MLQLLSYEKLAMLKSLTKQIQKDEIILHRNSSILVNSVKDSWIVMLQGGLQGIAKDKTKASRNYMSLQKIKYLKLPITIRLKWLSKSQP